MEEDIFNIIIHAGNARALAFDALRKARIQQYQELEKYLDESRKEITLAHNTQTKLVQADLNNKSEISLLLIHAQDQLMNTMSEISLIEEMILMQKEINQLKTE